MITFIYFVAIIISLWMYKYDPILATLMCIVVYSVGILHASGSEKHKPPTNMKEYQKFYNKNRPPKSKTFIQLEYNEETETYKEKQIKCHT